MTLVPRQFMGQLRRRRFIVFFLIILFYFSSALHYYYYFLTAFNLTCYFLGIPVQGKFPEERKDTHGNCNAW